MLAIFAPKRLLLTYIIVTLMGILPGGTLNIPFTATLNPALNTTFERHPRLEVEASKPTSMVSLQRFIDSVVDGNSKNVVGVYVPGVLALPVGQQPRENAGYVTREPNLTTQFRMARQYGTVGILAHNDLAGDQFTGIAMNQYAIVVFGDGHVEYYQVREVQKYQALSPTSAFSDFINMEIEDERLSAGELFNRIYAPGDRLVFQTCIAANEDPSWGRMFIIATPVTRQVKSVVEQTTRILEFASFGLVGY
jgi:prepilin-type processing-associated H-X9-DG protein